MQASIRRIHKLQINTRDETSIAADVNTLQDAFRTASLPGLPQHGLLLIKKLDLGNFLSRSTSMALSKLIDNKVRSLTFESVCVDNQEYPQQNSVWFSDPAQAVLCLVNLVARNKQPRAWYWAVIFPSWRPDMNLAKTLIAISEDFSETQAKIMVMAQTIKQLLTQCASETILNAVSAELAQALLIEAGAYQGPTSDANAYISSETAHRPEIPVIWIDLIHKAVTIWGKQDSRTQWLTLNALVTQNPALIESSQLLPRITAAIDIIQVDKKSPSGEERHPQVAKSAEQAVQSGLAPIVTDPDATQANAEQFPAQQIPPSSIDSASAAVNNRDESPGLDIEPQHKIEIQESSSSAPAKHGAAEFADKLDYFERGDGFSVAAIDADADSNIDNETHDPQAGAPISFAGYVDSDHCGLAFLISLLELLSIKELLVLNPMLAETNFPARVIFTIARRLKISSRHPVLQCLPDLPSVSSRQIKNFICPSNWRFICATPNEEKTLLHRYNINEDGSECYITDRTKKLLLYVGPGCSADLPDWISALQPLDESGSYELPTLDDLEITIQLMMCRYLYRYARLSLRQVINRNGKFASTKTHLDILFDAKQVDIQIRRSGLDIDPGWVAWIARVVQFHYDDGDRVDA